MSKVINLFGGPGAGKSTIAAEVFANLKRKHLNVELVTEYAKELLWQGRLTKDFDPFLILASQSHRISVLLNKVDYIVTDSPILLNLVYSDAHYLNHIARDMFAKYNNYNFFIQRNPSFFQTIGRIHNKEESLAMDKSLLDVLELNGIPYSVLKNEEKVSENIVEKVISLP